MRRRKYPSKRNKNARAPEGGLEEAEAKSKVPKIPAPPPERVVPEKTPWYFHLWKIPKAVWFLSGAVGVVLTLLCGFYSFYPFVSVGPQTETSTGKFDDTRWIVSNNYPLTLYNVGFQVWAWEGDPSPGVTPMVWVQGELIGRDMIPPHVSVTKRCTVEGAHMDMRPFGLSGPIEKPYYNIWITYDFYPLGIKQHREEGFAFWAQKNAAGVYEWNPDGRAKRPKKGEPLKRIYEDY